MKKGNLFAFNREIGDWIQNGSILAEFNKSKINDFYKEHRARLEKIFAEVDAIRKSHMVFEGEEIKRDENKAVVWQEGKTEVDFNKAWNDLMDQDITDKYVPTPKMEVN